MNPEMVPLPGPGVVDQTSFAYQNLFGFAADPSGGETTIASGALASGAEVTAAIPATFGKVVISGTLLSTDTAARAPIVQVSTDDGATYDTTAGNYDGQFSRGGVIADTALASLVENEVIAASGTTSFVTTIENHNGTGYMKYSSVSINSSGTRTFTEGIYTGTTSRITNVKILINGTGSFDGAGTYAVTGS